MKPTFFCALLPVFFLFTAGCGQPDRFEDHPGINPMRQEPVNTKDAGRDSVDTGNPSDSAGKKNKIREDENPSH